MDQRTALARAEQFRLAQFGILFRGSKGWIYVSRQGLSTHPESLGRASIGADEVRLPRSNDHRRTDMDPSRRFLPERFKDKDFAISWIRRHGEGRVFYCSLGHNPHIFWNPPVLEHFPLFAA